MGLWPLPGALVSRLGALCLGLLCLGLAGCQDSGVPKELKPVPHGLVSRMDQLNMKATSKIFIRLFKESSELEVWKETRSGSFALLKTYAICKWSGALGPKKTEGDRQAPEGFYTVTPAQMNPKSSYYLSFNIGYPNAYDRALERTGSNLMVHGACSSSGCYSMSDEDAGEIFALARDSFRGGQTAFQIQALPFRMTAENLARHRDDANVPFWKMIKVGSDEFELTRRPPKIDVCEKRYVFNADAGGASFNASAPCPPYSVPEALTTALAQKQAADDQAFVVAVAAIEAADKRKADQAAAAAMEAAMAEQRAAERAANPSLVTRVLARVGIAPEPPPAKPVKAPAAAVAAAAPAEVKPAPKAVAAVPVPRPRPAAKVPAVETAATAPTAAPEPAPTATASIAAPTTTASTAPPATTDALPATSAASAAIITPEMTAPIPPVGKFVKKKFWWGDDEPAADGAAADGKAL